MKSNFWASVTIVVGILFAIAIVCLAVFQIKKLEFAHEEAMADKALVKEILIKERIELVPLNRWDSFISTLKKIAIEICPSFIIKFLGF